MRVLSGNPSQWETYDEANGYTFADDGNLYLWKLNLEAQPGTPPEKRIAIYPSGIDWKDKGGGDMKAEYTPIGFKP